MTPDIDPSVPSTVPSSGSCSLTGSCDMRRRSYAVPGDLSAQIIAQADEFLLAATLTLARKYSNSVAFRIGIRRGDLCVELSAEMPSHLTLTEHRRAVSAGLVEFTETAKANPEPQLFYIIEGDTKGIDTDLVISRELSPDGIVVHVDFHEHVYFADFIERMLEHLVHILKQSVERPTTAIGATQLLSEKERANWASFNDTQRPYPRNSTVFEVFSRQAEAHPDRIAVEHGDSSLTYRQMMQQSERVAAQLHAHGVGLHTRVALQLEKTPLWIVAVLSVLRLGAAYVPVAAELPATRRSFLLSDSGAAVLLTDTAGVSADIPVLDLTAADEAANASIVPDMLTSPEDNAYIMYTSGSTGRPKGVEVTQRGITRLVLGTNYLNFSPEVRMLQTGAVGFDASTFELWGALLNGGTLVLVPNETILSASDLASAIKHYGINTMHVTAGLLNKLVEEDASVFDGCRVVFGGDTASASHVAEAFGACPRSEFVQLYGPTENTVASTFQPITRTYSDRVPIGRPIANSTAWILDRDGNLQPIGVPGELHVGGDGLCVGYLGRPDLNALAFTSRSGSTERLYRTGDIALMNSEGELEFLGRADNQVKIRGYRVELGEVELRLSQVHDVNSAVVLSRRESDGMASLCGFFTADSRLDPSEVRANLKRVLPDYMVPDLIRQVDAMPLTINQKIDKVALARLRPDSDGMVNAPVVESCTPMEAKVARIFSDVLNAEVVAAASDFFDLGGHSLRAMSLQNRIRRDLGIEIKLRQILEARTVRGVAAVLEQSAATSRTQVKLVRRT